MAERAREFDVEMMKMEFEARLHGADWRAPRASTGGKGEQGVGEYCGGKDLAECTMVFGERLAEICRTCPN